MGTKSQLHKLRISNLKQAAAAAAAALGTSSPGVFHLTD